MENGISREEHEEFMRRMEDEHKRINHRVGESGRNRAADRSADGKCGKAGTVRGKYGKNAEQAGRTSGRT